MLLGRDDDTIAAVATATGTGGIGVVRISGSQALATVRKMAPFLPEPLESHRVYFGTLQDPKVQEKLDEVLITYFAHGKSFTGEEVVEISCHGGEWIVKQVLHCVLENGARLAERGEFTFRAFSNGKLDLVQAESVLTLIESRSKHSARSSLNQLKGHLSKELHEVLDDLTFVAANLEANIDFAQEDIVVAENEILRNRLLRAEVLVKKLLATEMSGNLYRQGFTVAFAGLPNVGKSSLLNAILGEERAIVTPIAGTTRDLVEGSRDIAGIKVNFMDTAGLRESDEVVEAIGIRRARQALEKADLVLFVYDSESIQLGLEEYERLPLEIRKRSILVKNKCDLDFEESNDTFESVSNQRHLRVSAKSGIGIEGILLEISKDLKLRMVEESPVVISARHGELLRRVEHSISGALHLLSQTESPDLIASELSEGVLAMHEILGLRFDDQVMDRVFNEFCLGK